MSIPLGIPLAFNDLLNVRHPAILYHSEIFKQATEARVRDILVHLILNQSLEPLKTAICNVNWKTKSSDGRSIPFALRELNDLTNAIHNVKKIGADLGYTEQEVQLAIARSTVSEIFINTVLRKQLKQHENAMSLLDDMSGLMVLPGITSVERSIHVSKIEGLKDLQRQSECYFVARDIALSIARVDLLRNIHTEERETKEAIEKIATNLLILNENEPINMRNYGSFSYALEPFVAKFEGKTLSETDQAMCHFFNGMIEGLKFHR